MDSEAIKLYEMERDELIARVLSASTQEQCEKAEQSILAWMQMHPRDYGMLDAGEQLAMMSERYDRTAEVTSTK